MIDRRKNERQTIQALFRRNLGRNTLLGCLFALWTNIGRLKTNDAWAAIQHEPDSRFAKAGRVRQRFFFLMRDNTHYHAFLFAVNLPSARHIPPTSRRRAHRGHPRSGRFSGFVVCRSLRRARLFALRRFWLSSSATTRVFAPLRFCSP